MKRSTNETAGDPLAVIGVSLGMLLGAVMLCLGLYVLAASDMPMPLAIGLVLAGGLDVVLCWLALFRNRVGWAFATALNGTLAIMTFFGATKLRDVVDVHLVLALVPAVMFGLATLLLALAAHAYDTDS